MKRCTIFAGGIIDNDLSFIDIENIKNSYVICADIGLNYADKLDIMPDVIIGDCDSLGFVPENAIKYPQEKDDTDLMLAVKEALDKGHKYVDIYGGFGGRFDHMFGNIQTLAYILEYEGLGRLISQNDIITLYNAGEYLIENIDGYSLSLFSYSDIVEGLSITGTKYTADNITLTDSFPLGISNIITDDRAKISFKSGKLLIVQSKLD